mmetsp:Transcript_4378/g.680  ORF Transcript_4378/g.680 Transcript_4378/m.680 type:complete len:84 (+) Transcript_4378:562-813(+)
MPNKIFRMVLACCTCQCWFPFASFMHNTLGTCKICMEIFKGAKNGLFKVLFILFMCFCGFKLIHCFLCIMGIIHCFKTPCQSF